MEISLESPRQKLNQRKAITKKIKVNLHRKQINMAFQSAFRECLCNLQMCLWVKFTFCSWWFHIAWRHLGCALLILFLSPPYYFTPNYPAHVSICLYVHPQILRQKSPQSYRLHLVPSFHWKERNMRVEHNSFRKAQQEVGKRQTAKEENSILNLQNLPQQHWNTRLTLRWGISEAEDSCQPWAVIQLFTHSLQL